MQALPAEPQPFCGIGDIALAQIKDRNDGFALDGLGGSADQLLEGEALFIDIGHAGADQAAPVGEPCTISNILNFKTFQVVIAQIGRTDGQVAVAVSVASLLFVLVLLLLIPNKKRQGAVLDVDIA